MRKLAVLAAISALALAAPAAPQARAATKQQLVVTGTGTVAVDWDVTTATRLDFDAATITTRGDVVAFAVEDVKRREIVGLLADSPRFEYEVSSPVYGPIKNSAAGPESTVETVDLQPGRYRLRLVSHAASRVVLPVTRGRGATLVARTKSVGTAMLVDPRINGSSAAHWVQEFGFHGRAMGMLVTNEHTYVYGTSAIDQCVQQSGEKGSTPCHADPWFSGTAAFGAGAVGDGYCRLSLYFNEAWMPSGTYRAEVITTTVGVDKDVLTMLVVVEPLRSSA